MGCPVRGSSRLCDVPDHVLLEINAEKRQVSYPAGATLYQEGERSRRAFIICKREVKLTPISMDGTRTILKIAKSGELLRVSELLANQDYIATAEALEQSSVACFWSRTVA